MAFAGAACGVVKSTITSAPWIRSATELSSVGSARPASSMSSAPSTAAQTASPMRPAAPDTRTLIASASGALYAAASASLTGARAARNRFSSGAIAAAESAAGS